MGDPSITRRRLLVAGAGALAGAAVAPHAALALGGEGRRPRLAEVELGPLGPRGISLPLAGDVQLVGLQWRSPASARPQARVRLADGRWGPWAAAGAAGHGPDGGAAAAEELRGEPLWTGGARQLELRSAETLRGARLHLVAAGPAGIADGAQTAALALAEPQLQAGAGQPPIIAREAWAQGICPPRVAPEYGQVLLGFVHHTENPNGYSAAQVPAMLRAIYAFHRYVNGWDDIGYNFVVDHYGRIFEARAGGIDEAVTGAQAGGYNLVSTGVAVLGSFMGVRPPAPARNALQRLLAWKLSLHGTPAAGRVAVRVDPAGASYSKYPADARVTLPRVAGHRDADSTDCPGDALYAELPAIRTSVHHLAGQPVSATLALQPSAPAAPAPAPAPGAPQAPPPQAAPPQLLASVAVGGAPLAGAPLVLQARAVARRGESVSEMALAEGVSDAQGRWAVPASFAEGARAAQWVRVLCPAGGGHGAAVSPAVKVAPLPALRPPANGPSS